MSTSNVDDVISKNFDSDNKYQLRNSKGWDGKQRMGKRAEVINGHTSPDTENENGNGPAVEQIEADEGG